MKTPIIPQDVKSAVSAYLMARTFAEVTREKVDAIHLAILQEAPIYANCDHEDGHPILESKDLYLADDQEDEIKDFYKKGDKRLRAAGLKPAEMEEDFCPALVAECLQRDTERLVIHAGAEMVGKPNGKDFANGLLCLGLEQYQRFVDLTVGMVVNSPGFKSPLTGKAA